MNPEFETVNSTCWRGVCKFVADLDGDMLYDNLLNTRQLPTPPSYKQNVPKLGDATVQNGTPVSISTTFHPSAQNRSTLPDAILLSQDAIFYVHTSIFHVSDNDFHFLLTGRDYDPFIDVQEDVMVLNTILYILYDMFFTHHSPTFSQAITAIKRLAYYGVDPKSFIVRHSSSYTPLLSYAPLQQLDMYTLAARYGIHDLAVSASSHLLSLDLSTVTGNGTRNRPDISQTSFLPPPLAGQTR
ncbi:hypothetical protein H0H87_006195 [Tephrocybe sp. NHM501043]|nr:hypothetical protein H0H87_006195 [Tephrocybe sp. NHM501043]